MKRRAQFIWTPTQPIDHDAYFRLVGREPLRRDDGVNRWILFRRKFELSKAPTRASLKITCDGRHLLYVNGVRAARGPVRASPHYMRVDEIDAAALLHAGENVLAVLVHTPGVDLAWYETTKGAWQPVFGDGGLYVDLEAAFEEETVDILSDDSWLCHETDAWRRDAPRAGWGQDFVEDYTATKLSPDWMTAAFDDSGWARAQVLLSQGGPGDVATGRGGHRPFPTLLPREIPQLTESFVGPDRVVWTRGVHPRPDLPLDRQLFDEELCTAPDSMFSAIDNVLTDDESCALIKTVRDCDASFMLAFEPYITGCPFIEIDAAGGEIVEVAAAEALPGEFRSGDAPQSGLKRPNHLTGAHLFRYHARPGRQRFEKFEWTSARALQVNVRNAPNGLKIRHVGVRATNYPVEPAGAFSCSDPLLNDLWRIGRHTAIQCMHDSFEDCPGREKRQWVGDGVVHLDIAEAAFGPSAYPLGRQFLRQAAESQRPDGLIQMFAPGDHRENGVIIPDFTLHWVRGVARFWRSTGDIGLVEDLFPAVEKALQWFRRLENENGLLADLPYWHFIEWAHVGRSGESAPANALYAAALYAASNLAEAIESKRAARRFRERADAVRDALNRRHWSVARKAYVDEVEPKTGAQGERISQQSNALMVAFDLAPPERRNALIATISDESVLKFTAAPPIFVDAPKFDQARDIVRANTFFCHFLYEAYAKAGRFDLSVHHMRGFYKPMLDAGATTLWESFEPSASLCHVFSATPVYQLSRWALGVEAVAPGFDAIRIAPQFGDLDWARGAYPTPRGAVHVEWRRDGQCVDFNVEAADGVTIAFEPPPGMVIESRSEELNARRRSWRIRRD